MPAKPAPKLRTAKIVRKTGETSIALELDLDGTGKYDVSTGRVMLDHMMSQLARHAAFDMKLKASVQMDPDGHHLVEDVAIAFGQALNQALGDKKGIARMANASVPLDEALATVALDISGRGYSFFEANFTAHEVGDLITDLVRHFFETLAREGKMNIHAQVVRGVNDHHKVECLFKSLARSLGAATRLDPRFAGVTPSTKDMLEK